MVDWLVGLGFVWERALFCCLYYYYILLCITFAVGHGQSEGDRVHVEDFHEYIRDTFQHFDSIAQQFPTLPRFIIGHSMVLLDSVLTQPVIADIALI